MCCGQKDDQTNPQLRTSQLGCRSCHQVVETKFECCPLGLEAGPQEVDVDKSLV